MKEKEELYKRQLSNSENYDKAILSYSVAALGFSIAFIRNTRQWAVAEHTWVLLISWIAFVFSIILVIISFMISQKGIEEQLEINRKYYEDGEDAAADEVNKFANATKFCNYVTGSCFIVGIVLTAIFVGLNMNQEGPMADQKKPLHEGAPIPQISKPTSSDIAKGAPVPGVQRLPREAPATGPTNPPSEGGSTSSNQASPSQTQATPPGNSGNSK
ncbi:MAG: proline-rich domain-containing protein [bacterium]|nr:proline-rich domain-containing protein [bacterium]